MRNLHWFDFERSLTWSDGSRRTVSVEATVIGDGGKIAEIKSVKVKLLGSNVEVVPTDEQLREIYDYIYENCEIDEPGDDWRNDWKD